MFFCSEEKLSNIFLNKINTPVAGAIELYFMIKLYKFHFSLKPLESILYAYLLFSLIGTFVLNHQIIIWAVSRHCKVTISNNGKEFRSFRLYISRTIDNRFHMPSGSRPRSGLKKLDHSAADWGAVVDK